MNDANCFTLSEAVDGAGKDYQSIFGIIIGTGFGGALSYKKKIIEGANQIAGDWGHQPLPYPTKRGN
jgi:fructokinase